MTIRLRFPVEFKAQVTLDAFRGDKSIQEIATRHRHRIHLNFAAKLSNEVGPPQVAFYNQRGKAEQYIKEGKNAIKWTRLSCRKFRDNEVRLQLHALAYNPGNFIRTLALPQEVGHWSLTTLREKLVKIGAKVVSHGRYVTFQLAEVAVP